MNKNLELKLKNAFPKLLIEMYGEPAKTWMAWGISCDDGWYDIIYKLCDEIQQWSDKSGIQITAKQIKEKFGTLKFYARNDTDKEMSAEDWDVIQKIILKYENLSKSTCELTGGVGKLKIREFLYKTLCEQSAVLLGFSDCENKHI